VKVTIDELRSRAARLTARLSACDICPRKCGSNRLQGEFGYCRSGALPVVSSYCLHYGEEPVLSGTQGSGTIFFANCNLRCVFCQNYQISQNPYRQKEHVVSIKRLADIMLELQSQGCHNINLVSPTHFAPQILQALAIAVPEGLKVPLVYNTNAYDSIDTLMELDGVVDIYLPDIKYASNEMSNKYSTVPNYVKTAREAIKEMFRQAGELKADEDNIAQKGVIVRHLILPNGIAGGHESLLWLAHDVSPAITVSIMSQYHPMHNAARFPEINRRITPAEYNTVTESLEEAGLENGWVQGMESADNYLPDFEKEGHPFKK